MFFSLDALLEVLVYLVAYGQIFISPYTKVEESFNIQACHDILYHSRDLDKYDHHQFPGVVPRTFLGPLVVSIFAWIPKFLFNLSKLGTQYAVRIILATRIVQCLVNFSKQLNKNPRYYGVKFWMLVLTLSQFHLLFYSSRPLPNIFALGLVLPALTGYAEQNTKRFVLFSAAAILIFRAELAILLGLMLIYHLAEANTINRLKQTFISGFSALAVYVPVSVLVDSYFWKRWLWPELEVLYFNTVLNKSGEWGVMPFTWYFYSALPRSLMTSLPAIFIFPFIARKSEVYKYLLPTLAFVFIYSFLPHKELRFIIYSLPLFNYCIAVVFATIWNKRSLSLKWKLGSYCVVLSLLANLAFTSVMTFVSSINYPGGHALVNLHYLEKGNENVRVHMDIASCQTGITRFLEANDNWEYDKTENMLNQELVDKFTHLLILKDDFNSQSMAIIKDNFDIIDEVKGMDLIKETITFRFPRFSNNNSTIYVVKNKS